MNPLDRMANINIDEWIQGVEELTEEINMIMGKYQTIKEEWERDVRNIAGAKESAEANQKANMDKERVDEAVAALDAKKKEFCALVGGKRRRSYSRNKRTRKHRR